ncbi:hypothetical protein XELAEV_18031665mg [Xenopus laevis]|uniref:Uncharacterized protein n=1 Tax=Xenopus laevis TaxID=8355 RepID=A0A974CN62_XENLA|nr:hypothetical protein XELAEV_18031665mg [Xenopus laevis]
MGMSASSRLYYQWRYEKHSRWISPDLDIFEIRDFEDPLAGPYLECIRDKIIGFALYNLWMAKDCVKFTKWWKLHLKNKFWQDYRYIKAHLKHLYKDLEINKAILIKNNESYSDGPRNNSQTPLGRPCIPFHSILQTANAGVCRLPGVQWNGKECSIHCAS